MRGQFVKGSRRGQAPKRWARKCGRHTIDYLEKFPGSPRKKINEFMIDEIRGEFTREEKIAKITHLLTVMRRKRIIENRGTDKNSLWFYIDSQKNPILNQCKNQCKTQIGSEDI